MISADKKIIPWKKPGQSVIYKSLSGLFLLLLAYSIIVSVIGYRSFTTALLDQYAEGAFLTAYSAADEIDASRIDEYAESMGKTKHYMDVWNKLNDLCNTQGATFIYVIQPDLTDYAHIKFLFSTANENSTYTLYDFGYVRKTTNSEYRIKYRQLYEGKADRELLIRDTGYIETDKHITAMIPIRFQGETKAILCVQRQMDKLADARNGYLLKALIALILLAAVIIAGQGIYLSRVLLRPLSLIMDETSRYAKENRPGETKLSDEIRTGDEIGQLAGTIDRMEEQIEEYVGDLTKITAEKERMNTELSVATRIQEGMLPSCFPAFPERSEFDIYAVMDPAREVGGDFYNFFFVDEDHLCMMIADVSGKGIPAALYMMASMIILRDHASAGLSPAQILKDTNDVLLTNNEQEMFVTVWLGILEISTGKVVAANAGHEYPVLRKPGGEFELFKDRHGFVLGGMEGMKYRDYEFTLEPGSMLFLYTDGLPEASDAENAMFGTDRMISALNGAGDASPQEILRNVRRAVDDFANDAAQFDDLTMLCMEYRGPGAREAADEQMVPQEGTGE